MFNLRDYRLYDVTVDYIQTVNNYDGCQEFVDSFERPQTTIVRVMTRLHKDEDVKKYVENIYFEQKREPKVTKIERIKMIDKMLIDVAY